jgi:hypothetical protein
MVAGSWPSDQIRVLEGLNAETQRQMGGHGGSRRIRVPQRRAQITSTAISGFPLIQTKQYIWIFSGGNATGRSVHRSGAGGKAAAFIAEIL